MPSQPQLMSADPLAPQFYLLERAGFTALLLRTSDTYAVASVRVAFRLDPKAPLDPNFLLFPIILSEKSANELFGTDEAGATLREEVMGTILSQIEHSRKLNENSHLAPFGRSGNAIA